MGHSAARSSTTVGESRPVITATTKSTTTTPRTTQAPRDRFFGGAAGAGAVGAACTSVPVVTGSTIGLLGGAGGASSTATLGPVGGGGGAVGAGADWVLAPESLPEPLSTGVSAMDGQGTGGTEMAGALSSTTPPSQAIQPDAPNRHEPAEHQRRQRWRQRGSREELP